MTIPAGFCQASFLFAGGAAPTGAAVVMGFDFALTPTPAEVAEELYDLWNATFLDEQVAGIDLVGCLVKMGPDDTGPSALHSAVEPGAGDSAAAPPNVSVLVRKNTALGGRKGRGRMYIPGVAEADSDGAGVMSSVRQAAWQAQADTFLVAAALGGLAGVVLHEDATTPTPIISLAVDGRVATQRRRLRR